MGNYPLKISYPKKHLKLHLKFLLGIELSVLYGLYIYFNFT